MNYDLIVIGGGIIGLSTAWQLVNRYPDKRVLLLEKEPALVSHQSGHNSGVIHSGVYYPPGSFKSEFCIRGKAETIKLCMQHDIPYEQCGKLLVATNQTELIRMQSLYERCSQNQVTCDLIGEDELKRLEPAINGLGAILVYDTGIVDFRRVGDALGREFIRAGGTIKLNSRVCGIEENDSAITVITAETQWQSAFLVCCAGLQADRLTNLHGMGIDFRIIPFRGEYYRLPDHLSDLISHLIYPIPDPNLPFLGIHLTRMIEGGITIGPNAVLGWEREGYGRLNFSFHDTIDMLGFGGFWRLAASNFRHGAHELFNSMSKRAYVSLINNYCSHITSKDLLPHPAGIRAQAVLFNGTLVDDFLFVESQRSLHVCNAPSPAATSAIPIGEYLCNKISEKIRYQ